MTDLKGRKLYRVTVEFDYIALASSAEEARDMCEAAVDDISLREHADVMEMKSTSYVPLDWTSNGGNSLVYVANRDEITLGDAWHALFGQKLAAKAGG